MTEKQNVKDDEVKIEEPNQNERGQDSPNANQLRIEKIRAMIHEERNELNQKVRKITSQLLVTKKYANQKKELERRVKAYKNYSGHIIEEFYHILTQDQYIQTSSEIDINERIDKFKRHVIEATKKLTVNIDSTDEIVTIDKSIADKNTEESRERSRAKGKNSKISQASVLSMNLWLLKNFENPYPSNEEKMEMAEKGRLQVIQVNNWFINARERTIKKYQCKEPPII